MATYLGLDLLPDRVRGVLLRTQLRRVVVASYAEVPILAEGATYAASSADALGGLAPGQATTGGAPSHFDGGAGAPLGGPSPFDASGAPQAPFGAPSPFGPASPGPVGGGSSGPVGGGSQGPFGGGSQGSFGGAPLSPFGGAPQTPFGAPSPVGDAPQNPLGAPSPFGDAPQNPFGAPSPFGPPSAVHGSASVGGAPVATDAALVGGPAAGPSPTTGSAGVGDPALHASVPPSPLSFAIAELLRRTGAGSNADIIACLPGEYASLRRIELPKAAEKKLDELLPFEMESLLPFDQADTLLDHQPIDSDPKQLRLLVCAATKSRIRETLDLLSGAGADPTELVPGAVPLGALGVLVPALAGEGPHVIVSVRPSSTDVCVVRKGRAELARTLSSGGIDLAMPPGGAPAMDAGEHFVRELKQTLLTWRMQGGAEPEAVFLAGDAPSSSGIGEWLSTALGRTVLPLALPDPHVAAGAPDASVRHGFATALGLALHATLRPRHIDLRKGDLEKKRSTTFLRELAPILSVAATAVACAFVFSLWARWSVLSERRELLEDELAQVSATRLGEETRSAARARRLLETGRHGDNPMPPQTAYDILVSISGAVPDGIAHDLTRLSIDLGDARSGGRLELQGTVGTIEEYDRIAEALTTVECVHELERGPLTNTADGRRNYRIEADILCASDDDDDDGGDGGDAEDDPPAEAEGEG